MKKLLVVMAGLWAGSSQAMVIVDDTTSITQTAQGYSQSFSPASTDFAGVTLDLTAKGITAPIARSTSSSLSMA